MLMMLAFLVDQTQELCCPLFQAVRKKRITRRSLWDHQRSHFRHFEFTSMQHLHEVMLYDLAKDPGEKRNLVKEKPQVVRRLASQINDWIETLPKEYTKPNKQKKRDKKK